MSACPTCQADVPAGTRWCGICHSNVVQPTVGKLASPGKRFAAYFLDLVIPVVALLLILFVSGSLGSVLLGIVLILAYVVWALALFARGTTPGKRALSMYVVKESGQRAGFGTMLFREWIGKWISGLLLMLGFLWILFDKDRQGWHDKLASTFVVEQRS